MSTFHFAVGHKQGRDWRTEGHGAFVRTLTVRVYAGDYGESEFVDHLLVMRMTTEGPKMAHTKRTAQILDTVDAGNGQRGIGSLLWESDEVPVTGAPTRAICVAAGLCGENGKSRSDDDPPTYMTPPAWLP